MTERMEIQTKVDKTYVTDRTVTDKTEIYEQLAKDLLHKKSTDAPTSNQSKIEQIMTEQEPSQRLTITA